MMNSEEGFSGLVDSSGRPISRAELKENLGFRRHWWSWIMYPWYKVRYEWLYGWFEATSLWDKICTMVLLLVVGPLFLCFWAPFLVLGLTMVGVRRLFIEDLGDM